MAGERDTCTPGRRILCFPAGVVCHFPAYSYTTNPLSKPFIT